MRRHAPIWEAELGDDDGVNDIDVYLRKSMDDLEEYDAAEANVPSFARLMTLLATATVFVIIALNWTPGA